MNMDKKIKKYTVWPYDNHGNIISDPVYIAAKTKEGAEKAGFEWLKILGVKKISWVSASKFA